MRTRAIAWALAALLALVSLAAACGGGGEGDTTAPDTTATQPVTESTRVLVYLVRGDKVGAAARRVAESQAVARAALEELLEGTTAQETGAGLATLIPARTRLLDVDLVDGLATLDFSGELDDGGGSAVMLGRLAQVVFTVTQFPSVKSVRFRMDGEPVEAFSSEGIVLDGPQNRADYEDQSPAILVERPAVGDVGASPLRITGTANTFEANFEYEVLAATGAKLAGTFVTATCGTGCRGTFDVTASFDRGDATSGSLVVFERSAKDGSRINEVKIPVRFGP